jgi:hypothetical protein
MSTKRSFASVPMPDVVAKLAAEAPGGEAVIQPSTPAPVQQPIHEPAQRPVFREREATQKMTVNMPKGLYEELRAFMKLTDIPMSDVLVEGAKRELARMKKLGAE